MAVYIDKPMEKYVADLASKKPSPGGGSVAALAGALGAALVSMVGNFTTGKDKYRDVQGQVDGMLSSAGEVIGGLMRLVDEDTFCYEKVLAAYRMPRETGEQKVERDMAVQAALKEAITVPLEIAKLAHRGARLCALSARIGNANLLDDAVVGMYMLEAAFASALVNVETNLKNLKDNDFILEVRTVTDSMKKEIPALKEEVLRETASRTARAL